MHNIVFSFASFVNVKPQNDIPKSMHRRAWKNSWRHYLSAWQFSQTWKKMITRLIRHALVPGYEYTYHNCAICCCKLRCITFCDVLSFLIFVRTREIMTNTERSNMIKNRVYLHMAVCWVLWICSRRPSFHSPHSPAPHSISSRPVKCRSQLITLAGGKQDFADLMME